MGYLLIFVLALVPAIGKKKGELTKRQISGKPEKRWMAITYNLRYCLSISVTLAIVCYLIFTLTPKFKKIQGKGFL